MPMSKEDSDEIENMPLENPAGANGGVKGHDKSEQASPLAEPESNLRAASTTCYAAPLSEIPIFQIIEADRHIKVYANGLVEGCDPGASIVNYLFNAVSPKMFERFTKYPKGTDLNLINGPLASYVGLSQGSGL